MAIFALNHLPSEIDSTVASLQLLRGRSGYEGESERKVTAEEEVDYPEGDASEEEGRKEEENEEEFLSAESDCKPLEH